MNRIVIVGESTPSEPVEFKARLRRFDASLTVSWNRLRRRWVIEQCVEHLSPTREHTHICRRVYVWLVQGDAGEMLPLGEHVFAKLAAMDTWRQGYGPEPKHLERWRRDRADEDEKAREKQEEKMAEVVREASRDARGQLLTAKDLLLRHH